MKTICTWCGITLKERDQDQLMVLVSHGICVSCAAEVETGGPAHGWEEALGDGQLEEQPDVAQVIKYACSL